MDSSLFEKYYNSALRYLSYRPRSEKEIRDFLGKKKAVQETIEKIISQLREQNLINDEEFAKWWIEQRTVFRPKGIRLIKLELKQKGISLDIIEATINNPQLTINKEIDRAKKLIKKRIERYKGLSKQEIYTKLGPFLARRGFVYDTIKKSIDELIYEGV